jgi:hypothetical protein
MKIGFFIRTYDKDLAWLKVCLGSILKFGSRSDTVVVCDSQSGQQAKALAKELGFSVFLSDSKVISGYIRQQADKLKADLVFLGYDTVCFVDSDTRLTANFTESEVLRKGKLSLWAQPWKKGMFWRKPCEECLGYGVEFEYDNGPIFCCPLFVLKLLRKHIENRFNTDFDSYAEGLRVFSEYSVIGEFWKKTSPETVNILLGSHEGVFVKAWATGDPARITNNES